MPHGWTLKSEHISIPEDKKALLEKIQKTAGTKACFDVFVWHDDEIFFFEAKADGKDHLTQAQLRFIEGALTCGIPREALIIVEWKTGL